MSAAATTTTTEEWGTPPQLFAALDAQLGPFTLDAAASDANHKCRLYYTAQDDGLSEEWTGHRVWVNPPYGRNKLQRWIVKAHDETAHNGCPLVAMLVPARTGAPWWRDIVMRHAAEVWLMAGRLRFHRFASGTDPGPAPSTTSFDVCVIVFRCRGGGPPVFRSVNRRGEVVQRL